MLLKPALKILRCTYSLGYLLTATPYLKRGQRLDAKRLGHFLLAKGSTVYIEEPKW